MGDFPRTYDPKNGALPVSGYRPQSQSNVDLVNINKDIEERVLRLLDDLKGNTEVDQRWLAIGRTSIETGFMAVNRAVFKPGRTSLPDDTARLFDEPDTAPPEAPMRDKSKGE